MSNTYVVICINDKVKQIAQHSTDMNLAYLTEQDGMTEPTIGFNKL